MKKKYILLLIGCCLIITASIYIAEQYIPQNPIEIESILHDIIANNTSANKLIVVLETAIINSDTKYRFWVIPISEIKYINNNSITLKKGICVDVGYAKNPGFIKMTKYFKEKITANTLFSNIKVGLNTSIAHYGSDDNLIDKDIINSLFVESIYSWRDKQSDLISVNENDLAVMNGLTKKEITIEVREIIQPNGKSRLLSWINY